MKRNVRQALQQSRYVSYRPWDWTKPLCLCSSFVFRQCIVNVAGMAGCRGGTKNAIASQLQTAKMRQTRTTGSDLEACRLTLMPMCGKQRKGVLDAETVYIGCVTADIQRFRSLQTILIDEEQPCYISHSSVDKYVSHRTAADKMDQSIRRWAALDGM